MAFGNRYNSCNEGLSNALRSCVIDNIRIGNQIGRGANGRILEAKWEGIVVAVKEIHSIFMNEVSDTEFQSFKKSFLRECEQSSQLRHPNIVRFLGIYNPPGAKVPSLVMERLHCSLTSLLEENPVVPIGIKLSIIKDVALGLRYLHSRNRPNGIIHRDLSSNNVLVSKGMEGKIGDLGTARLVDPRTQSKMTKAPGTVDFMPPEALAEDVTNIRYGKELDVFSLGCVMLHTLSHQWPTPSQAVIINPETGLVTGGRTEVERRRKYFERIDGSKSDVLIPLIESCLNNLPKNRSSIVRVCDRLEGQMVDRETVLVNELTISELKQEIQQKDVELQKKCIEIQNNYNEIQAKDAEMQKKDSELQTNICEIQMNNAVIEQLTATLHYKNDEIQKKDDEIEGKSAEIQHLTTAQHDKDIKLEKQSDEISKLQIISQSLPNKANKSSSDFWNSLKLTWEQCANLSSKYWASSVTELNGKVYAAVLYSGSGDYAPIMYDANKAQWSSLPVLPYARFSLVAVPEKNQLLAIGGVDNNKVVEISSKVFLWDEVNSKWTTPYPNMPTARYSCSSVSHKSTVIVAGGVTCWNPRTVTRVVEVLYIKEQGLFNKSYWSVVEQLPHVVYDPIPLIVNDKLYIAIGFETDFGSSTCNVMTASLPELLKSINKNTSISQVWSKLPDMPYSSYSINHYQGRLITFGGDHKIEGRGNNKLVFQSVSLIHIYNANTRTWDCVGEIPHRYLLGASVHLSEDEILFIGGLTGAHDLSKDSNMITTCPVLKLSQW